MGGWRKAVKRQLISSLDVKFLSNQVGEEAVYTYQILKNTDTVGFIQQAVYNYVQHTDSLSHTISDEYPLQDVAVTLGKFVKNSGDWTCYGNTINSLHIYAAAVSADRLAINRPYKIYLGHVKQCIFTLNENLDNNVGIDYSNMPFKVKSMYFLLKNKQYFLVWLICRIKNYM